MGVDQTGKEDRIGEVMRPGVVGTRDRVVGTDDGDPSAGVEEERTLPDRRRVAREEPRRGEPEGQFPPPGRNGEWSGQKSFGSLPLA